MGSCLWTAGRGTVLLCVTGGFAWFNAMYPYLAGFIQFSVYATAGELLSGRMLEGHWQINRATWFKSVSWGVGGLFVTLAFSVFSQGTQQAMAAGLLPGYGNALALAFFTSCTNNLFFAPIHSADAGVWNYGEIRFLEDAILRRARQWTRWTGASWWILPCLKPFHCFGFPSIPLVFFFPKSIALYLPQSFPWCLVY